MIGRNGPEFGPVGRAGHAPIEDRHVSRRALLLSWQGQALCLERPQESSRAQVAGRELQGIVKLSRAQLEYGVALTLAHTVILLLRFDHPAAGGQSPDCGLGLCGSSNYLASLRRDILRAAGYQEDVLIRGETGSGKELVARAIHDYSPVADKPLVAVNMAAVPAELAAALLFGNARGAFTGADRANDGYFQQAEGGTLFLDEVGDTPPGVQPQLLRALQQREIQPVGGRVRAVSLRVISATDAPLESEDCDFKSALRHRLGSLEIRLLPLREHPEDISELSRHFLAADGEAMGKGEILPGEHSSQLALAQWAELFHQLVRYHWPGNVRELANACRQIVAASDVELTVPDHIRALLQKTPRETKRAASVADRRSMREVGEAQFERAWEQSRYEPAGTARLLGVSRQSVYRRIVGSDRYRLAGEVEAGELRRVLGECGSDSARAALRLRVSLSALRAVLRTADLEWR